MLALTAAKADSRHHRKKMAGHESSQFMNSPATMEMPEDEAEEDVEIRHASLKGVEDASMLLVNHDGD